MDATGQGGLTAQTAQMVQLAQTGHKGPLEALDPQDHQGLLVQPEIQVCPAIREQMEQMEMTVMLEILVKIHVQIAWSALGPNGL